MADNQIIIRTPEPGAEKGSVAPPPVASQPAGSPAGNPPPNTSSANTVPLFGGNRGGRARADGLAPGSPAAVEADKKKDRERKQTKRVTAAAVALPPPLPPAVAPAPGQLPATVNSSQPGVPGASSEPVIPWTPDLLKPLFEALIDENEKSRVDEFETLAKDGGLAPAVCKEVGQAGKYQPAVKTSLKMTAPAVAADVANQLGISGKYSNVTVLLTAIVTDRFHKRRQFAKLEKLIAQSKQIEEPTKEKSKR